MAAKTEATSASDAAEAAAGVGSRRTTSNLETDTKRQNIDVGADEANQSAVLDQTRSWNANTKSAYDTLQEELHATIKESQSHLANVHTIQQQMLTSMVGNADALNKQHLAHSDLARDRIWNVDEVSDLVAKSGVQADTVVALMMKVLADAASVKK